MRASTTACAVLLGAVLPSAAFCYDGTGFDGVGVFWGKGASADSVIVYTMDLRSGSANRLWGAAQESADQVAGISFIHGVYLTPDGKRIVFAHGDKLSVMNNDGTSVRDVLTGWTRESWCLTANGVFYFVHPPDHHFQLYHVSIETGVQELVYTFSMPICDQTYGTDVRASQDGLRLFTRADMPQGGGTSCLHADNAFISLYSDLTVADLGHAFLWGHGSAVSRDGRYTFHVRWEEVPGYPAGEHRHFWVCDFATRRLVSDVILRDSSTQLAHAHMAVCENDDNYIGAFLNGPGSVIFERGDELWSSTRQYAIPSTPYAGFGNFWRGALPAPEVTPVLYVDKRELVFAIGVGDSATQSVAVTNSGGGTLGQVTASHAAAATWLTLALGGSGNIQTITNTVSTVGLADGVYRDTVLVSGGGAVNSVRYPVTLNVNVLPGPTSLVADVAGDSLLDAHLVWSDNSSSEDGFAVERSGAGALAWSEITRTTASVTNYSDVRPPRGTLSYRVRAFDAEVYSAYSNVGSASVLGRPWIVVTSPPVGAVWETGTVQHIRWSASLVSGVTIHYSLDQGETWTLALSTGGSIARGSPQWGDYPWTVPNVACAGALIKVDEYGGATSGMSAGFPIVAARAAPRSPYLDSGWTGSAAVYLNTTAAGANVAGAVVGFPVLVRLNGANFDFSLSPGGGDIRFTKADGTVLPFEIERWSDGPGTADAAEIWVRMDTVYGLSTQHFYLYWGRGGAASRSSGAAVFGATNGYAMEWHLGDSAASPTVTDATGGNDGVHYVQSAASNTSSCCAAGVVGRAQGFDRTLVQYVRNTTLYASTAPGDFSVSFWVKVDGGSFDNYSHSIGTGWGGFQFHATADASIYVGVSEPCRYGPSDFAYGVCPIDTAVWTHYVYTCPASANAAFYKNGATCTTRDAAHPDRAAWSAFLIGSATASNGFSGKVDELSVAGAARNADWVKLCYENQKADQTLVTVNTSGVALALQAPMFRCSSSPPADLRIGRGSNGLLALVTAPGATAVVVRVLALNGRVVLQRQVPAGRAMAIPLRRAGGSPNAVVVQVLSSGQRITRLVPALN